MKVSRTILAVLASFLFCLHSGAEINVGSSLEWLTDTAGMIAVYEVTSPRPKEETRLFTGHPEYDIYIRTYDLQFRLLENWKGDAPAELGWEYAIRATGKIDEKAAPAKNDRFLIFLKRSEEEAKISPERVNQPVSLIDLRAPASFDANYVAITSDFEVVTDGNRIVDIVRQRLRDHATSDSLPVQELPSENWIEVPIGSSADLVLNGHSGCFLLIPQDIIEAKHLRKYRRR